MGVEIGQKAGGSGDEERNQEVGEHVASFAVGGASLGLEASERERRDGREFLVGELATRVVAFHPSVTNCGLDQAIVDAAVLEERTVCGFVVPVARDVFPERVETRVVHKRSSSIKRFVMVKYSLRPYGSFKM